MRDGVGALHRVLPAAARVRPQLSRLRRPAAPVLLPDPVPVAPSPWDEMVERLRRATAGEFEIGPELGRGGMAAVFLAHELALRPPGRDQGDVARAC